jgi:hypothetical protein
MERPIQFEREVPARDARERRWIASWIKKRELGRLRYVLRYGVLLQGVPFAIAMTLVRWFGIFGEAHRDKSSVLLFAFAFYAIGFGSLMGLVAWRGNEKAFKGLTAGTRII